MLADIPSKLPRRIQDNDAAIWRAWMDSRQVSTIDTKRDYVRQLVGFYQHVEQPIEQASETDINAYEQHLREIGKSAATITHAIRTVRNYWTFAREKASAA